MQATQIYYSVEEYLEQEKTAEFRSEYRDGKIIPMTGGTVNHNRIFGNFYATLKYGIKGQPYETFMSDLRLSIPTKNIYTYPDVMVISTPVIYAEGRRDTITNPQIIIEVLSRSTESYDRGQKFEYYRRVNSLREYILIDQYRYYVEQFSKTEDGKWWLSEYEGDGAILSLSSVEFQISLSDIYENVEFE
ncbi:MAG: Uma2 family endonuclease [Okeania sp. SIO2G4]|uniref:Uma2 family endonuclease n=1 Tax=unclassified Okeania TaxID=2634635 RepID=UPI0013BBAA7B|nr:MULTISPECIES: Uma2 family endonuclease [unclassified Okeania]NEP38488.1 Uma2 family endonuclease [Okeania sp. SIO2H7]NEP70398.1 Uma2 family endonuclease [Okeania sp. SIO2G5]NEP91632.1 Uma2 family endonuclease [Okeania sp. SIO2F5]NEQ92803.1 Uma2 family endonuclease [Okeania sp. SIO2G4]